MHKETKTGIHATAGCLYPLSPLFSNRATTEHNRTTTYRGIQQVLIPYHVVLPEIGANQKREKTSKKCKNTLKKEQKMTQNESKKEIHNCGAGNRFLMDCNADLHHQHTAFDVCNQVLDQADAFRREVPLLNLALAEQVLQLRQHQHVPGDVAGQ